VEIIRAGRAELVVQEVAVMAQAGYHQEAAAISHECMLLGEQARSLLLRLSGTSSASMTCLACRSLCSMLGAAVSRSLLQCVRQRGTRARHGRRPQHMIAWFRRQEQQTGAPEDVLLFICAG
jgi:hypothetical protein